jgi:hypothetical protein
MDLLRLQDHLRDLRYKTCMYRADNQVDSHYHRCCCGTTNDGLLTRHYHSDVLDYWRVTGYFWCRIRHHTAWPGEEAAARPTTRKTEVIISAKKQRSWQTLLLLQALNVPTDIAWPIIALAYWLL